MSDSKEEVLRTALQSVLAGLPEDYPSRYAELVKMSHVFHQEIAKSLEPAIAVQAKAAEVPDLAERRSQVTRLNEDLRRLHLALRCPKTQRPAILIADIRTNREGETEGLRFRLQVHGEAGKTFKSFSSNGLPPLDLMEDAVRIETFSRSLRKP